MNPHLRTLLTLNEQCCLLCDDLIACFEEERRLMVEFKTEELQENNVKKEELIRTLAVARENTRRAILELPEALREHQEFKDAKRTWLAAYERMKLRCEGNQSFIQHSLKNLEMITDNLMRLLGQLSLYNNKGHKTDLSVHRPSGKVVEGTY